jgi:vacuolar-type H+-ATPase subunit C/Vma6
MGSDSVREADRRLEELYFQALRKVLSISPFGLRQVLEAMAREQELKVLSSVLNGIIEGIDEVSLLQMVTPFGRFDEETCKRLLETGSVRRAIELVEDPAIKALLLDALGRFGSERQVGLDLLIDRASAKALWGATMFLTGRDSEGVKRILGQRFDLLNLLLLARTKKMGISSAARRSLLLQANYRLKASDLDDMAELSTPAEQLTRMRTTFYSAALQGISTSDLDRAGISLLETVFNRYLARECSHAFSGSRFTAGLAVAFLFLKRFETNDLKAILTGKAAGLSKEEIREKMILHQDLRTKR